jgi:lipoprotein signal peptidase
VPLVISVEYVMTKVKRVTILILLLLACVGCDQTTKYTARQLLPQDDTLSLAGDTIRLQYIENAGAFLGMGASLSQGLRFWLFTVAVLLGLSGLFFYLISSSHTGRGNEQPDRPSGLQGCRGRFPKSRHRSAADRDL